ncbi:MAG: arylamine N-acetyltransferase [Phenylobacterium sp.]
MELAAYLRRIGYSGAVRPDLGTLRALHRAHLLTIPYDALDIQFGRPVTIDPATAYQKIVERGRGGWCYEMNGLFGWALQSAGFEVIRHSAEGGEPASHLVLEVRLGGQSYVCDVGFASGPLEPYPLVEGAFVQRGFEYRLEKLRSGWRFHNHPFALTSGFSFDGPDEPAMAERCRLLQSDPDSTYVLNAIVVRNNAHGYSMMLGRELRRVNPHGRTRETIASASAYVATLRDLFGLDLPEAADLWPSICRRHEQIEAQRTARVDGQGAANR